METNCIAFIVPAYNVENYIDACLDSIMKCKRQGDEIILINDGSTDATESRCKAWVQNHADQITFISQHNQGLSAARNIGIRHSTAPYILFVDSDDVLIPTTVEQVRSVLDQYSPDILACDFEWWYPGQSTAFKRSPPLSHTPNTLSTDTEKFLIETLEDSIFSACSRIFKSSLIQSLGPEVFPVGDAYEEIATVPRLTLRAKSLYYLNAPLLHYRVRPNSITTTKSPKHCIDLAKSFCNYLQEIENFSPSDKTKIASNKAAIKLFMTALRDCGKTKDRDYSLYKRVSLIARQNLSIPINSIIKELKLSSKQTDKRAANHLRFFNLSPNAFLLTRKLVYSLKSARNTAKYRLRRKTG